MSRNTSTIFVLDTSVILYDFNAINNFQEHDVAIPITVLEELDRFKKGDDVINLQAREFVRELDRLSASADLRRWVPINGHTRGRFRVISDEARGIDVAALFGSHKNDHRILSATISLCEKEAGRRVVLVSKDINLRVKARSLGLYTEDYESVRIEDVDQLYSGKSILDYSNDEIVDRVHRNGCIPVSELLTSDPLCNHYFILRGSSKSALAFYNPQSRCVERVARSSAYGILPRNAEQTFGLHAILNPNVSLVTISGPAGTGKTLLALAGALEQRRNFRQIYLARPMVPLANRDIGYLPGDINSKVTPYMQPLWDNLAVIRGQFGERQKEFRRIDEMLELEKLQIVPLAYIRGRSFSNIIFIVDEAQNLTPHEVKTIITRAGEGTKIVFTGDLFQIDTPYLDSHSNGLSYLIGRIKNSPLYAHINLDKGVRSELASLGSTLL